MLLAAAVLLSTGGAAIKLTHLTAWQVASFRSGIAALVLLWLLPASRHELNRRALVTGIAYAGTMILFVLANKLTTAANAIFLQSTAPLYLALLAPWLLGEPTERRDLIVMAAMGLGLGLFFVGEQPVFSTAPEPLRGNLIAMFSGVTWALTVMGVRWISRDPQRSIGGMLVAGNALACIVCLPLAVPVHGAGMTDLAVVTYLGVFQIAVAYLLVSAALRHLTALEGILLLLVEPVLNPLWAGIVHGERPSPWSLVGGA
ncbi:MAG TPA: DMT family transporter, partial [Dongiaceae bacterium]|nr:DMT family transporter [Dongiaceae bacterium]